MFVGGYERSSRGTVVAIAQETRQQWKAVEKCVRRAWYCGSLGGNIDHDFVVGMVVDCCKVGGGGKQ